MALTKEKIADWLEKTYENDYFMFDHVCSRIQVDNFEQKGNQLFVEYHFWDDGHSNSGVQQFFLFDLKASNEYGVNFPAYMELVKFKTEYVFETKEDCEQLKEPIEADEKCDTKIYEWGDPEIDEFIEGYFSSDNFWLAEMLINYYDAKNGLPSFIPIKLKPYFEAIVKTRLEE